MGDVMREFTLEELKDHIDKKIVWRFSAKKKKVGVIKGVRPVKNDIIVQVETDKAVLNIKNSTLYRDFMFLDSKDKLIGVRSC